MIQKPFSLACENNKEPILKIISTVYTKPATVWEIGSGTGQHGCYFARHLPHIEWQPTDRAENIAGINLWRDGAQLANLKAPLCLDVADTVWPCQGIDYLFTANTLHIMSWETLRILFARLAVNLNPDAWVCVYGPFNYNGNYTSDSNAQFDQWLKSQDSSSGIKNIEDVVLLASENGLKIGLDIAMPANNRMLVLHNGKAAT